MYGLQPARAVMRTQKVTTRQLAERIRVDEGHLTNVLRGRVRPCAALRQRMPLELGVPIEQLLTADAMQKPFAGDIAGRPRVSGPVSW
jgi:transcriptional regulator with XRE-family HTH domain